MLAGWVALNLNMCWLFKLLACVNCLSPHSVVASSPLVSNRIDLREGLQGSTQIFHWVLLRFGLSSQPNLIGKSHNFIQTHHSNEIKWVFSYVFLCFPIPIIPHFVKSSASSPAPFRSWSSVMTRTSRTWRCQGWLFLMGRNVNKYTS